MVASMTGYGTSACEAGGKKISVEIRSLNSKQLDVGTRIPLLYREKELEIRNMASRSLKRGKIDITITVDLSEENRKHRINSETVNDYIRQLRDIGDATGLELRDQLLQTAMRLPDVLSTEKEVLSEAEWEAVTACLNGALDEVIRFRKQEGKALEADMRKRVASIIDLLEKVNPLDKDRQTAVREKLEQRLTELEQDGGFDRNRLEQEMIYYLEKMDVTEEKVRLANHCDYFIETLDNAGSSGKKLGFISQEMGREINTLGSKASDSAIQKLVVEMKDELEKIKEQLLNVL
jgi:uncharacterized protein (TIGR00255 family)